MYRFCFICNYLSKMIPAIQSRCTRFRFAPLSRDQMVPRIKHIVDNEGINVTDDGMSTVVRLSNGDMRRALNMLQVNSLLTSQQYNTAVFKSSTPDLEVTV